MANVTVIGAQWGDEGKGKIVDWLSERADVVARFQGGHNAGHTLVVGEKVYKLSLLPSGIVRGTLSVIGNGVVLDPWHFRDEVAKLKGQGVDITPENLQIAETCPLILPFHRDLDGLREDASGAGKIGTTRRGIGPAYEDKVGRRAIRVCDLAHLDDLGPQLELARDLLENPAERILRLTRIRLRLECAHGLSTCSDNASVFGILRYGRQPHTRPTGLARCSIRRCRRYVQAFRRAGRRGSKP